MGGIGSVPKLKMSPTYYRYGTFLPSTPPLLWGQYWNTMDWLLIAMASAFAIVTVVLCVVCSRSPKEKRHERLIVYHRDGYEIEPAEVPEFNPTWRNERWGILSAPQPRHRNQKGGSRA